MTAILLWDQLPGGRIAQGETIEGIMKGFPGGGCGLSAHRGHKKEKVCYQGQRQQGEAEHTPSCAATMGISLHRSPGANSRRSHMRRLHSYLLMFMREACTGDGHLWPPRH